MELTIEQALQEGITAHKQGKLQDAERFYRAILQAQPNHPDANHNLGALALAVGKPLDSIPFLKLALEADSTVEQFWLSYIDAIIKLERFDEAKRALVEGERSGVASEKLKLFHQQIQASPSNDKKNKKQNLKVSEKRKRSAAKKKSKKEKAQTTLSGAVPSQDEINRLLKHYQSGEFPKAEELAISLTQMFPTNQFGWKALGAVLKKMGRLQESLEPLQKSAKLSPQDDDTLNNLAVTLQKLGRLDEAEGNFRKALAIKPNNANAHTNLGNTLRGLGRLADAEACFKQAIAIQPGLAEAHNNLGVTLQELGRLEEAEASCRQAISLKPDYAAAHNTLGVTLKKLGRVGDAEGSYRQATVLNPGYAAAHTNLGTTLQELGRLDEAEASYRQAIVLKPDNSAAYCNLGTTLQELGRLDEAEASYRQAIVLKPDNGDAYSNLGSTLKELGRLDEAEASYRHAIAVEPDKLSHAYDQLGVILQSKGQFEEAEVCYKKCISLEPDRSPTTASKGTRLLQQGLFELALAAFDDYGDANSKGQALEALYALGRIDDIYERIESRGDLYEGNLRVAAIAAFLAERENKNTAHQFCNNPLDFIYVTNIASRIKEPEAYFASVINELRDVKSEWEPRTTQNGFQASVDVFKNPLKQMGILKSIIVNEIDAYYSRFENEFCSFIKKFPSERNIEGWHVILKQQGHQTRHIHVDGWLSGVIYLSVVPSLGRDEGAIEFSLDGPNYLDAGSSKKIHQPRLGDLIFFPSSLHHRTLPFSTDIDRVCVAFDLMPCLAKH